MASLAAETSGTQNATQAALEISAAQIATAQSATVGSANSPVVPYKVGGSTYPSSPIMGNFSGTNNGTYYPYPTISGGIPVANAPGPFTGANEEWWPDYNMLNQYNAIWTQTNYLYRI